jgi:hypothetical protein
MLILIGIQWNMPLVMLGMWHGPSHWTEPFILFGIFHSVSQIWAPLYVLGLASGYRYRIALKGNLTTNRFMFGVECREPECRWATPISDQPGPAYTRQEIHHKATGHQSYELFTAKSTQLEVI